MELGTMKPISYYLLRKKLIELFKELKISIKLFASHSLRSGAASAAIATGASVEEVKRQGGWISEAINCYIFPSLRVLLGPAKALRLNGKRKWKG